MLLFKRLFISITLFMCMGLWACAQYQDLSAELTDEEMAMPEAKYYSTDFAPIPDEVADAVAQGPVSPDKALALEDVNQLTRPGYLAMENGYTMLDDNTAYVAVRTDMPGVTRDMIRWWFWWHALKDVRYKIWDPGAHYAIDVMDREQMADPSLTLEERFQDNPHYPMEDVGSGVMPLSIRFITPEEFGFDPTTFEARGVEIVICGVVGFKINETTIEHTYMCHVFRKKGNGLELRSRFWIGKKFNMPKLRKVVITEDLAVGMLMHCSEEYTHLAGILPDVYAEFGKAE